MTCLARPEGLGRARQEYDDADSAQFIARSSNPTLADEATGCPRRCSPRSRPARPVFIGGDPWYDDQRAAGMVQHRLGD